MIPKDQVLIRLDEMARELEAAMASLSRAPSHERMPILQRVEEIKREMDRGQALLARGYGRWTAP